MFRIMKLSTLNNTYEVKDSSNSSNYNHMNYKNLDEKYGTESYQFI